MEILTGAVAALLVVMTALFVRQRAAYLVLRQEEQRVKSAQKRLRTFAKEQMLAGNVPSFEQLQDYNTIFGLEYPSDCFVLLVIKVRRHSFAQETAVAQTIEKELTAALGRQIAPEFVAAKGLLVCFFSEPKVTLAESREKQEALRAQLADCCSLCAAKLQTVHQIDALFAVGKYDFGGFALHTNYISAKALLEQAMCAKWPGNVIADAGVLSQKVDPEFTDARRQFYNCFVCYKFQAAAEHLFHMVQLRMEHYFDSFSQAREIVATQIHFCTDMLELPFNIPLDAQDGTAITIRELMASPDEAALQQNLGRFFSGLSQYIAQDSANADPTGERIFAYIASHFSDPDLSVAGISGHFHLNTSYVSRLFKQEYGSGVLECIHKTRIARAKELIAAGTPIGEVSTLVGYTNRRAFDNAFSRYEGITPKVYQDQIGRKDP